MGNAFVNQELEVSAKRTPTHLTGAEDTLKPLYLQPDRALFSEEHPGIIFKVYLAGKALQHEYAVAQQAATMGFPIPTMLEFAVGPPAVLDMKQVLGQPLSSHYPYAAKAAGNYLQRFHTIGAHPPFSGGQSSGMPSSPGGKMRKERRSKD